MGKTIIDCVRRSLRNGYCVPVIGAGVSIPAGVDSWRSHLAALASDLDPALLKLAQDETADPIEVATLLIYEGRRNGLQAVAIHSPLPSTLHQTFAGWRCRLYMTTNFGDALERAIEGQGESFAHAVPPGLITFLRSIDHRTPSQRERRV